jgi:hypothetical protein
MPCDKLRTASQAKGFWRQAAARTKKQLAVAASARCRYCHDATGLHDKMAARHDPELSWLQILLGHPQHNEKNTKLS